MAHPTSWLLIALCGLALLPSFTGAVTTLSDWINGGTGTFYGGAPDGMDPYQPTYGTKEGSCGYGVLDKSKYPFWSVAALNPSNQFYKAGPIQGCGQCFQIECVNDGGKYAGRCNSDPNQRSVIVMISDSCPTCADGPDHIDMQALTFQKIAPMSNGRINIRYRRVECTPPADLQVDIMDNNGQGKWTRLVVEQAAGRAAVQNVFIKGPKTAWLAMNNLWGAAWETASLPGYPTDMRIVSDDGEEVTGFGVLQSATQIGTSSIGVQFSVTTDKGPASDQVFKATYYGGVPDGLDPYDASFGTSVGSCGYGLLDKTVWPYWSVGALATNNTFYKIGPIRGCGSCFEIQCLNNNGRFAGRCGADPNSRTVTIQITDACPECEANHIDLQALTFDKIAPMSVGRIDMQYRRVNCNPPADMVVAVDQNPQNGGWIRFNIQSVASRASVSKVQIRGKDSSWTNLNNIWGAVWELGWTPQAPLDVHIIQDDGQEVTAYGIITRGGKPCTDAAPATNYSCQQQQSFGRCQSGWMLAGDADHPEGFCQQTCGRCKC
ncbi:hypothetical protein WJX72_007952 [[Myrmecia] bisecta]|uniref:Expansin n=1 Tax=[Myrmecia] bisecta TaxID=41462 RepID=A0AAW1QFN7_9CHLO